jgi:hypothetical protein
MQQGQNDHEKNNLVDNNKVGWKEILLFIVLLFLLISATMGLYNNDIHFFSYPGAKSKMGGRVFHFRNAAAVLLYIALLFCMYFIFSKQFGHFFKLKEKLINKLTITTFVVSIILFLIAVIIASNDGFYGGPGWY